MWLSCFIMNKMSDWNALTFAWCDQIILEILAYSRFKFVHFIVCRMKICNSKSNNNVNKLCDFGSGNAIGISNQDGTSWSEKYAVVRSLIYEQK